MELLQNFLNNNFYYATKVATEQADDEIKICFYDELTTTVKSVPKGDILIIMGDLNAKIGSNNENYGRIVVKHRLGEKTKMLSFC